MTFKQYGLVRVRKLLRAADQYDGWEVAKRAPRVGDVGTVLDILERPDVPTGYVVECLDGDPSPEWLSIFSAEELEPVD